MAEEKDKKPDPAKKKYAGKFDSDEELAKAYTELEKKLGGQGEELGQTKRQFEEAQKALATYAQQLQQLTPYADWYRSNEQALAMYQNWLKEQQAGGPRQPVAAQNGGKSPLDILTPEERDALFMESAKRFESQIFKPWQEQFGKQLQTLADERAKAISEQTQKSQQAFTEVLWRTIQRGLPEDKVKAMREWHEQAIQMANVNDPMKAADEWLTLKSELAKITDEKKALQTEHEKLQKASLPSVSGAESPGWAAPPEDAPKNRSERFSRVMSDTKEKVGAEGMRDFFGRPGA